MNTPAPKGGSAARSVPTMLNPLFYDWDSVPVEHVMEGATRQVIAGENIMLVLYHIKAGTVFPRHNHPHEQFVHVIEGVIRMDCDNGSFEVGAGSAFHIPSGAYHAGVVLEDLVEIDVFSPIREDYLPKDK